MEEEFRALLLADADVVSQVAARVNFGAHPQGDPLPAIVLNTISDREHMSMNSATGLSQGRVQVDCYAHSYGEAKRISRAAKAVLHGYRGGGFFLIRHDASRDGRSGGANEVDRPYRSSLDFLTSWRP